MVKLVIVIEYLTTVGKLYVRKSSQSLLAESANYIFILLESSVCVRERERVYNVLCLAQEPGCNFLEQLDKEQTKAFRKMVIDMVCLPL